MVGSDLLPSIATIGGAMHAIERTGNDDLRVRGRQFQGADRHAAHPFERLPGLTAIGGTENIAGLVIDHAPGRNVDLVGVGGIDSDVVENVVVTAEMDEADPAGSAV